MVILILLSIFIDLEWELSCRSFAVGLGPIPFVMVPEVSPANVSPTEPIQNKICANSFYNAGCLIPIICGLFAQL